ncbi:MAG: hypothetical protein OXT72_14695 [Gammaproteobacteria bacterium]|nr:hypothetical protein [Gammaproteobacteria bacterium]MDE0249033.1 hypothetical protein [Gammaproteobacteria bacterium]
MTSQLIEFAGAVRASTVRRLLLVPPGAENWRIDPAAMSFADMAQHLSDSDRWLHDALTAEVAEPMIGRACVTHVADRAEFDALAKELRRGGEVRQELLATLGPHGLSRQVRLSDLGEEVSAWWLTMRCGIEHEVHHRGQLVAYLRAWQYVGYDRSSSM